MRPTPNGQSATPSSIKVTLTLSPLEARLLADYLRASLDAKDLHRNATTNRFISVVSRKLSGAVAAVEAEQPRPH